MITANDLNQMSIEERDKALRFEGDQSKWIPAKGIFQKIGRAVSPGCHKPCGGTFRDIPTQPSFCLRFISLIVPFFKIREDHTSFSSFKA